jgi:hypothetical protein
MYLLVVGDAGNDEVMCGELRHCQLAVCHQMGQGQVLRPLRAPRQQQQQLPVALRRLGCLDVSDG